MSRRPRQSSSGDAPSAPASGRSEAGGTRKHIPALRFVGILVLLLGGFYALLMVPAADRALAVYLRGNALLSNAILHLLGQTTAVNDVTIRSADYAVSIRRGCDAVEPAWFFCAAVLAFPAPWRRKLVGMTAGATIILALNLVRIVSLYFIGWRMPAYFATAHLELWPAAFIVLSAVLWIAWVRWVQATSTCDSPRPAL